MQRPEVKTSSSPRRENKGGWVQAEVGQEGCETKGGWKK